MSARDPIGVLIVDDHDMVRKGLAAFLKVKPDLELVGEASDGPVALCMCGERLPDVMLIDLAMTDIDGIETTQQIPGN